MTHQPNKMARQQPRQPGREVCDTDPVPAMNGRSIRCARCSGHGLVSTWSFGVKEPDECADCGGSGRNWLYPGGAIARYYSGPFIGMSEDME